MRKRLTPLKDFLHRESSGGIVLLAASALGIGIANSPLRHKYFSALESGFEVGGGFFYLKLTLLKVINYILMTIFFFVVGLEIKRELTTGHLSRFRNAIMPFLGAIGGMIFPAAIYLAIAGREDARGWGVPVATDIALAVGLLAIIGSSVVPSLRTFLLGLAVIDDIGAILIIAFIYSTGVGYSWILLAAAAVCVIVLLRRIGVASYLPYIFLGIALWYFCYRSGIHATLSGVILGLLAPNVPVKSREYESADGHQVTVIEWLEEKLHPFSSFVIVPVFAFANTGVVITSQSIQSAIGSSIAWGIFFGLVLGKPIGILTAAIMAKRSNIGDYPHGSTKASLLATGSAAGIGFTVAIFIAHLAFADKAAQDLAIIAVIVASLTSGVLSWILFLLIKRKRNS